MNVAYRLDELTLVAEEAARRAGELVRHMLDQPRQLNRKGYRDLVTDADFASQKLIVEFIAERFPEHGFLTEEVGDHPTEGAIIWAIDPIDGTTNYSRQMPVFCVSVAAVAGGELLAGAICDPMRDEMFTATAGQGATLNGVPIHVSEVGQLDEAVASLDWSRLPALRQQMLTTLLQVGHQVQTLRAIGSAALAMAWIAAGRLDLYVNNHLSAWDVAAAALILREAGGRFSDDQGADWRWTTRPFGAVASNGQLHEAYLYHRSSTNHTAAGPGAAATSG